ncbi:MAG: hypothetical protein CVU97_03735 [Firmicutes bacterium HGW-Firmicutes-21]|nr:MAG: hypothetical protein CVU97_03735 [Firmicutes bacterium HGW-Firmicutes-21]
MSKFFQLYITYSKFIFKFWVTQITMSAFGLFVSLATIATNPEENNTYGLVVASAVFAIGFLSFLLYDMMFMHGLNHSVGVVKRGFVPNKLEGLKIALLAYAPTILIITLAIVFFLLDISAGYAVIKVVLVIIIHGTYNGFWWLLSNHVYDPLIAILTLVPGITACTLGYYLGLRDMPIRKLLGIPIKPPKAPKNKK